MKEFSKLMDALEAWVVTARGSREEILSGADLASAYMEYRDAPKPLVLEERITELEEENKQPRQSKIVADKRALFDSLREGFIQYQYRNELPAHGDTLQVMIDRYQHDAIFHARVDSLTYGVMSIIEKHLE